MEASYGADRMAVPGVPRRPAAAQLAGIQALVRAVTAGSLCAAGPWPGISTAARRKWPARLHCAGTAPSGEQAHDRALAGLGLVRRSVWDVGPELADGRPVEVLSDWTSDTAPIQVVFPSRRSCRPGRACSSIC